MDDGGGWRPARLTPEQTEERRLAAAALLRQGRLSQAAIARRLGVSGARVCRWAATLAQEGRRGLRARPRTGRPGRLDAAAWARLGQLLARRAVAAGLETEQWSSQQDFALSGLIPPRFCPDPLRPAIGAGAVHGGARQGGPSGKGQDLRSPV